MVRDKIVSLAMLVTVALILSVSLMLDATAALIGELAAQKIGMPLSWLTVVDFALIDVAGTTLLFAMLFRYLPDKQMSWSDTWFGALLTAILLAAGKSVIGIVIGSSQTATLYDAAGSILVIMLWVYYASAIFLFGASFTACRAAGRSPAARQAAHSALRSGWAGDSMMSYSNGRGMLQSGGSSCGRLMGRLGWYRRSK